jgi:hypothetical protein
MMMMQHQQRSIIITMLMTIMTFVLLSSLLHNGIGVNGQPPPQPGSEQLRLPSGNFELTGWLRPGVERRFDVIMSPFQWALLRLNITTCNASVRKNGNFSNVVSSDG